MSESQTSCFTARFAEQVYRFTSITTNQGAGWFLGLGDETVYRIDKRRLEEPALEKLDPVPTPKDMGVDEVAWQKGQVCTHQPDDPQKIIIGNFLDL